MYRDPNEFQPVSGHITDGNNHKNIFVTDNNLSDFSRMGVELQDNSATNVGFGGVHADRNTVSMTHTGNNNFAFSIVTQAAQICNTIWGNTITGIPGALQWGVEIGINGPANTSVEQNTISGVDAPFQISDAVQVAIQNNTIANFGNDPPFNNYAFSQDGGYNNSQWIGNNTINGVLTSGWIGHLNSG